MPRRRWRSPCHSPDPVPGITGATPLRRASADLTQLTLTPQPAHHPSPHRPGLHRPSRRRNRTVEQALRSIPACAGEPAIFLLPMIATGVYPRVCGGTRCGGAVYAPGSGLSPRVRGNRITVNEVRLGTGSIPACAGEPESGLQRRLQARVYPRVCGGTNHPGAGWPDIQGLSPRVRGNRTAGSASADGPRSIPACAGEPSYMAQYDIQDRVYPRVCGGTYDGNITNCKELGLSPRVRGNLKQTLSTPADDRSIPACAGEPRGNGRYRAPVMVYPRVCGGTLPHRHRFGTG